MSKWQERGARIRFKGVLNESAIFEPLESLLRPKKLLGFLISAAPYPSSVRSAVFDTFGCPFGPSSQPVRALNWPSLIFSASFSTLRGRLRFFPSSCVCASHASVAPQPWTHVVQLHNAFGASCLPLTPPPEPFWTLRGRHDPPPQRNSGFQKKWGGGVCPLRGVR